MSGLGDDDYVDIATFLGGHDEEDDDDEGDDDDDYVDIIITFSDDDEVEEEIDDEGHNTTMMTMTWTSHHQCYTGFSLKCDAAVAPQYSDNDMVRKLFKRRICSLKACSLLCA